MVRSHYNQDARLKNFAIQKDNKFKITLIDLINKEVGVRNTSSAFYQKDLYTEEMELELLHKVETPGMKVFDKIYNSKNNKVVLTRDELNAMQKYLLIQYYRNPTNFSCYYLDSPDDPLHFNKEFKSEKESIDHVHKMMQIILDTPWEELYKSNEKEIVENVKRVRNKATLFVRTNQEFVINDIGAVTETAHYEPNEAERQNRKNFLMGCSKKAYNSATEKEIDNYLNKPWFVENFTFFPISSNFGIITIEEKYTQYFKKGYSYEYIRDNFHRSSPFLHDNFSHNDFCKVEYIREDLIRKESNFDEALYKYSTPNDRYIYRIRNITDEETYYLNSLTINEARTCIGFKTPEKIIPSIKYYSFLRNDEIHKIECCMGPAYLVGEETILSCCPYHHDLEWVKKDLDWKKDLP